MARLALVALLCAAAPGAISGFLAVPRTCPCARGRCAVPPMQLRMNKLRGYYTVSEGNGGGWSLFQEAVEGAVFLGNRGARRRFTAVFSSQGPALASPLKVTDRFYYMRDPEADQMAAADSSCPVSAGSARGRQRRWVCNRARSPRGPRSRAARRTQWVGHACVWVAAFSGGVLCELTLSPTNHWLQERCSP